MPEDRIYYLYDPLFIDETAIQDCGLNSAFPLLFYNPTCLSRFFISVALPASVEKDITIFGSQVRHVEKNQAVVMSTVIELLVSFKADKVTSAFCR